jgi:hypothetical protein
MNKQKPFPLLKKLFHYKMKIKKLKTVRCPIPIFLVTWLIGLVILSFGKLHAQVAMMAGGHYSSIRDNIPIQGKSAIPGYNIGFSLQYSPFKGWESLSLIHELNFVKKGYRQRLDKNYFYRFNNLSLSVLGDYAIAKPISLQGGIEFAKVTSSNIKYWKKTYNDFDIGLIVGINMKIYKNLSLYSRLTYGLLPMLDYYDIDEMGNFKKEIHDVKNITYTIGIKLNISNEKNKTHR